MDLHRLFHGAELGGDLLVEQAARDLPDHLFLAGSQAGEAGAQVELDGLMLAGGLIAGESGLDGGEQLVLRHRLGQEVDRARFHRPHAGRHVAVAREENDRQGAAGLGELVLQFQPGAAGHAQVQQDATGRHGRAGSDEFLARTEGFGRNPGGGEQPGQAGADGFLVVHDIDRLRGRRDGHQSRPGIHRVHRNRARRKIGSRASVAHA